MRPDPKGLWCDYTEVQAEIEHLRDRIAGLEAAMDARTPELCAMEAEIERLREMLSLEKDEEDRVPR